MLSMIIGGLVAIALLAIVVGIMDAAQAAKWRRTAAERRERWEATQARRSPSRPT